MSTHVGRTSTPSAGTSFRGRLLASGLDRRVLLDAVARVRDELGTTSATILVLDPSGTTLEPVASVGLARTTRTAARVPLGAGFAGQIALTRQPRSLLDVSEESVVNPLLLSRGIRSLLGVPIFSRAELVGVLHVGSTTERTFDEEDVEVLTRAAARIGELLEERISDEGHAAALVLQRSLMPAKPRPIEGLDLAARYIPAEGDLGGDWYDVFELPDGTVGLVMGDVVGHGLEAAVVMGRLRSALRAYALDYADPSTVLERLDRKISYFEDGAFATVSYAVMKPPFTSITISSAGHWSPVLAAPGRRTADLDLPHDPMLGIGAPFRRTDTTVELPAGAALCFFTDGLVERRPQHGQGRVIAPEESTRQLLTTFSADEDAERACTRLVTDLIGDDVTDDDIALLVVRRA